MKLNFNMLCGDGILEARESNRIYAIVALNNKGNSFKAVVDCEILLDIGNLYECLDACNKHAFRD